MPFYEQPLSEDSAEYKAGLDETKKAKEDGSFDLLEDEYIIKFRESPLIVNYFEGPQYLTKANQHGGVFAVLQESMKRNIHWPILLGLNDFEGNTRVHPKTIKSARRHLQRIKSGEIRYPRNNSNE